VQVVHTHTGAGGDYLLLVLRSSHASQAQKTGLLEVAEFRKNKINLQKCVAMPVLEQQ